MNWPGVMHVWWGVQYCPSSHNVGARQVAGDWQVRGPPVLSSLQDVKPVTVEQSDDTEHVTVDEIKTKYAWHYNYQLPYWQILAALQKCPEEQSFVQLSDTWQVLAPPARDSLQTVVSDSEAQSRVELQVTM